ncbi:TraR/DksA family transcriptional regulator [Pseudomonas aeruginosa]|uniref:TraR/DksA family transcriptional regulator n=1 Tax=Pseudomonas aeruginosa TaxID=287 RepID=UPI0009367414|nr:TraR/DksA family transcriptional regulator [Pseudomonas aeruginosa]MDU0535254.1 TraR/DksA family transcriptional regulator [Pseudomonas aeruginosa]MEA8681103.1 TraR/DksA family transcriptional regulator [Pseudomonas aeruginosa]MEA8692647.1 TraR/DksA family transcriptional regulator [Pseudomonas aeruginosa]MEE2517685.1 TraR/DksA family transcriptional regulator [Pseudomonas aeruginosa]
MDIVDIANDYAERELADRLYSRVKYVGESLYECEDCGEEIPVARRELVPGVRKCRDCAELAERRASRG